MSDLDLVSGFHPKQKHPNAPDYVVGKLNINVAKFRVWMRDWLKANPDEEWLSLDMKISKEGKGYAVIDDWKPEQKPSLERRAEQYDDMPF